MGAGVYHRFDGEHKPRLQAEAPPGGAEVRHRRVLVHGPPDPVPDEVPDDRVAVLLHVALDRAVENILWLTFMYLALVPLWVPIVFLIRSFVVDGIRGVALARGKSGFGMMHSPLGRFLVASRFMRAFYGLAKAVVFGLLYLTHALALKYPEAPLALHFVNQALIFLSVGLCVARGIPVLLDGRIYFGAQKI